MCIVCYSVDMYAFRLKTKLSASECLLAYCFELIGKSSTSLYRSTTSFSVDLRHIKSETESQSPITNHSLKLSKVIFNVSFHFISCLQAVYVATLVAVAQAGYLGGGYAGYAAPLAYAAPAYHATPTYAAPAIVKTPVAYKAAPAVDYYVSKISTFHASQLK